MRAGARHGFICASRDMEQAGIVISREKALYDSRLSALSQLRAFRLDAVYGHVENF